MNPLSGIRVLDLSWLLPGPFATGILAELGADVIKVERRDGGDYMRERSPSLFEKINLSKRSVALDLKVEKDLAAFYDLVPSADIVVEGFRPGVVHRLRIDYETLRRRQPDLIYVSISGYGQSGPMAQRTGHDINYLAFAGALAIPGHWNERPRRSGLPVGDLAASLYAVINVLAALRERDRGGGGAFIDLSIADAVLHWSNTRFGDFDETAADKQDAWAHVHPGNDAFVTSDGRVLTLGLIEAEFWSRFCDAIHRVDLKPLLGTPGTAGKVLIRETLTQLIATMPLSYWEGVLRGVDVPFAAANDPASALRETQFASRGMVVEVDSAGGSPTPVVALPGSAFGTTRFASQTLRRAPALGADTEVVLSETGATQVTPDVSRPAG